MKKQSMILNRQKLIRLMIVIGIILVFFIANKNIVYMSSFNNRIKSADYGLELEEIRIEMDGVNGEYTFLYMTDNQANFDSRFDLGWFGNSESRSYRDSNGISSADNLKNWFAYANDSKVDAFLMGGDVIDFGSEENISSLQNELTNLEMPYIYTYGNHDSYIPWENRFDDENPNFIQLFKANNCEFQAMDVGELCIVSVRNYQVDGIAQISAEALEQFKRIVEKNKPIILICHVPICTNETESLKSMALEHQGDLVVKYNAGEFGIVQKSVLMGENCGYELTEETKQFLDIVTSPESSVIMVLSGHLHESWQGNISENTYQYVGEGAFTNKGALIHISGKEN